MRWPAFLARRRRPAEPTAEQRAALDRALAARREGRAERNARARRSAAGRIRKAYLADRMLREQVPF